MQEEEKQGANPAENNTLLYSRKLVVRTAKDLLAHKGEPHCFRCVQKKKQWILLVPCALRSTDAITQVFLSYLRVFIPLGRAVVVVQVQVCMRSGLPPPAGRTCTHGWGHWGCAWLAACVEVEGPGCFPTGFGYQSFPNGIPEGVDRGRGRNNLWDKLHCVGGWRLSKWPQEGVRWWHVIFE